LKKLLTVVPLLFLLCFTLSCRKGEEMAEETAVDVDADKRAIKALLNNNASAISAEDLDGWLALFTDDAIFMNPNAEVLKGVEASRMYATPVFEQFDHEIAITIDEVEVSRDRAFARWSFTWEFTPKTGGDTKQEKGKELWIFKRQADSSWKCSHIIWNKDTPPPASPEKLQREGIIREAETVMKVDADVEPIKDWVVGNFAAADSGDLDEYLSYWAENVIWMPPHGRTIQGKNAIKEFVQPFFGQYTIQRNFSIEEIEMDGDFAFARTISEETYTPKAEEGEPIRANSKSIFLLRCMSDGTWLCTHCIWNSNDPLSQSEGNQ
jgi:uncharacterized protein (TIGR02246 family)